MVWTRFRMPVIPDNGSVEVGATSTGSAGRGAATTTGVADRVTTVGAFSGLTGEGSGCRTTGAGTIS